MRKSILFLLLATTSAMPALAQRSDEDRQSRREARAERSESRAERPQRAERAERPQRAERAARSVGPQVQVEQQVQADGQRSEAMQRYQQQMQQRQQQAGASPGERLIRSQQRSAEDEASREQRVEQWRQRRGDTGQQSGGLVQRDRRVRPVPVLQPEAGQAGPVRTDIRRDGRDGRDGRYGRDGRRYDRDSRDRWNNAWRNDNRYNWRNYRDRHRSIFSIGFYFDPFGYNYRRIRHRILPVPQLLPVELLDQRPMAVSPAAGLWSVSLDPLS